MTRLPRWMICYLLLGMVQSGIVPIILPLAARPGATAGLTYAAFAAAGITAPFIGAWSDRWRRHRTVLAGGLGLGGLALLAHALPGGLAQHMASAAAVGLGVSAASTVGTMLIVEVVAEPLWDGQISLLQGCTSAGQLVGLLLAGAFGLHHVAATTVLAAGLLFAAALLAIAFAPDPVTQVARPSVPSRPARGGDAAPIGAQRSMQKVTMRALAGLSHSGLAWFLAAWLVSYTATNGLSVMFAVAMVRGYGTAASLPTTAYALGVGFSLLLYGVVAAWDRRYGPWRVLSAGLLIRAILVIAMVVFTTRRGVVLPILALFAAMQVIWPLLSVSSSRLSVSLSPAHRAESVGLLNAATAVGATLGGALGGVLLGHGFTLLCAAVAAALLVSLLLARHPTARLA